MDTNKNNNNNKETQSSSSPRTDYLNWQEYFMAMAILASKRSKDPQTQVGACIVNSQTNQIIGIGYNGFPKGCSDDEFPWGKKSTIELDNKFMYVSHAEVNAILNGHHNRGTAEDATKVDDDTCSCYVLYTTKFPCNECTKFIIQSGIKEIIYLSDKNDGKQSVIASNKMLNYVGIKCTQFKCKQKYSIKIRFNDDDDGVHHVNRDVDDCNELINLMENI